MNRDKLAEKIMFAIITSSKWHSETNAEFAAACYKLADEMIKVSKERCEDTKDMFDG